MKKLLYLLLALTILGCSSNDDDNSDDIDNNDNNNTSKWTLQKIKDTATNSSQILQGNFEDYLNGFSPNVKEIIDKFKLRSQVSHMASKDVLFIKM